MLFYEFSFLFAFLPFALVGYYALPAARVDARLGWLFVASCAFYAASSLVFLPLLLISLGVDYVAGGRIASSDSAGTRKGWLLLSLLVNLGALGFFKYSGLITRTLEAAFPGTPVIEASLPIGISFYTFQSMSYTIDVYRDRVARARSPLHFAAYVTLFPQLIAGPIVRYGELEQQLHSPSPSAARFADGVSLFAVGLAKKLIVADTLDALAAPIFALESPGLLSAWASMFLFAGQIYYDFSGYTDMAIGLGRMFGFEFPKNFDSPYKATSFSDFWRRWHITLSTWLRDYLYVPLGGNRDGRARTYVNLAVTMLLGGLWHGASWNFVLWGAAHGLLLAFERGLGERNPMLRLPELGRRAVVFLAVTVVWVPFRFERLDRTWAWLRAMFLAEGGLGAPGLLVSLGVLGFVVIAWATPNSNRLRVEPRRWAPHAAVTILLLLVALWVGYGRADTPPFLYFRF